MTITDGLRAATAVSAAVMWSWMHYDRETRTLPKHLNRTLARVQAQLLQSNFLLVDLMGRYSNQSQQAIRIKRTLAVLEKAHPERDEPALVEPHKLRQRLTDAVIADLVAGYEGGASGRELAKQYGLARSSVISLLRDRGVAVRHPRMSEAEVILTVQLYEQGMRQIEIAQQLGRSKGAIWHVLEREGVFEGVKPRRRA